MIQGRCIVFIKVKSEVVCTLLNGGIAGDPNPSNHPNFYILHCRSYIFVVGEQKDFKFGVQFDHSWQDRAKDGKLSLNSLGSRQILTRPCFVESEYLRRRGAIYRIAL